MWQDTRVTRRLGIGYPLVPLFAELRATMKSPSALEEGQTLTHPLLASRTTTWPVRGRRAGKDGHIS